MKRVLTLVFGMICYLIFFLTFLYAIGFVGNMVVPKSIDTGASMSFGEAIVIDIALLVAFALQHSVMARPHFKQWWTKIVPASIERSIYVLLASSLLILLFWQWRPIDGVIWETTNPAAVYVLWAVFFLGWALVLVGTFLINHFELFGLSQVFHYFTGKEQEALEFRTPVLYKIVRHPIMLGFIIAFWATPRMTAGHLVFAVGTTAFILVAIQLEERDLIKAHGENYKEYRSRVSMIVPMPPKKKQDVA